MITGLLYNCRKLVVSKTHLVALQTNCDKMASQRRNNNYKKKKRNNNKEKVLFFNGIKHMMYGYEQNYAFFAALFKKKALFSFGNFECGEWIWWSKRLLFLWDKNNKIIYGDDVALEAAKELCEPSKFGTYFQIVPNQLKMFYDVLKEKFIGKDSIFSEEKLSEMNSNANKDDHIVSMLDADVCYTVKYCI